MAQDKLNQANQQRQRLQKRAPAQLKQVGQQRTKQTERENLDTVEQGGKKWTIAGIVMAGVLVATAAGVGSQFKLLTKGNQAPPANPNTTANTPATAVNQQQEQQGQMLLGQAQLLANQGQPQQLAQAIAILQKVPGGVVVTSEAQNLAATWSQQIMEQATAEASGGQINQAIATANLIPANSPQHQQAQQQVQQWQQQLAQAQEEEFAATLAEAAKPVPLAPITIPEPAPVTTTPVAVNPTPEPTVAPQAQPQTQAAPKVAPRPEPAAATVNQPPSDGKQGQSLANDPYLNVQIPQVTQPQVQSKATTSSTVALSNFNNLTGNSYGFGNMVAKASTVAIQIRDNVDEDGDFVSLIVNGEVITSNEMIYNHGKVFMVDLLPGENKVEIDGVKDGQGGITLEVNVAGVGNINETPIPEGSTASFIINREQ